MGEYNYIFYLRYIKYTLGGICIMLNNGRIYEFYVKEYWETDGNIKEKKISKKDALKEDFLYRVHLLCKNFRSDYYAIIQSIRLMHNPCIRMSKDMPRSCRVKLKQLHEVLKLFKLEKYEEFMTGFIMIYDYPEDDFRWDEDIERNINSTNKEFRLYNEIFDKIQDMMDIFYDEDGQSTLTYSKIEEMHPHAEKIYISANAFKDFLREKVLPEIGSADNWSGMIDKILQMITDLLRMLSYVDNQCHQFIKEIPDRKPSNESKKYISMLRDAMGSVSDFYEFFLAFNSNTQKEYKRLVQIMKDTKYICAEGKYIMDAYGGLVGYYNKKKR